MILTRFAYHDSLQKLTAHFSCSYIYIYIYIYTVGKISIEHVTIFLSKYISKGAVDMKCSPDVGNNPSNPYTQTKQNK